MKTPSDAKKMAKDEGFKKVEKTNSNSKAQDKPKTKPVDKLQPNESTEVDDKFLLEAYNFLEAVKATLEDGSPNESTEVDDKFLLEACNLLEAVKAAIEDRSVLDDYFSAMGAAGYNMDGYIKKTKVKDPHGQESISFYAVQDGHGSIGYACSKFIESDWCNNFNKAMERLRSDPTNASPDGRNSVRKNIFLIRKALMESVKQTDEDLLGTIRKWHQLNPTRSLGGSTGAAMLLYMADDGRLRIFTVNLGDSSIVLCSRGKKCKSKATLLTVPHRIRLPKEREPCSSWNRLEIKRIEEAGEKKESAIDKSKSNSWKVKGSEGRKLAMTRAFGDLEYKEPAKLVSAVPTIKCHLVRSKDELLVCATDGVADRLSYQRIAELAQENQSARTLVREAHKRSLDRYDISSIFDPAKKPRIDDATAIIVRLVPFSGSNTEEVTDDEARDIAGRVFSLRPRTRY